MMLTQEQFEMTKSLASLHDPDGFEARACETIEALRKVARAAEIELQLLAEDSARNKVLEEALDALPDWITDG